MPRLPLRPRTSVRAVYLVTTHPGLRRTNQHARARGRNWLKLMLPQFTLMITTDILRSSSQPSFEN